MCHDLKRRKVDIRDDIDFDEDEQIVCINYIDEFHRELVTYDKKIKR